MRFNGSRTKVVEKLKIDSDLCLKSCPLDPYLEFIKFVLPEVLVDHFDLVKSEKKDKILHLSFEERNVIPKEIKDRSLLSKGFHKEITIQDFPLRGSIVYLYIKRRRWQDKNTNEIVQRDWTLVAQGTRMTVEFAAFLKVLSQY